MPRSTARERFSFANLDEVLPLPDLIAIQRDSFQWFLDNGLAETFRDISPIEDFTGQLRLELEFEADDIDLRPPPKFTVEECKEKDMTFSAPIFVRARFMNATTGEIKEQTVFMGDFPMMTDKGTFIVNGTERVVVSQLVRSPGVIFQPGRDAKTLVTGTIHPYRGEWIEFDVEAKPGKDLTAGARVARKRRLSLFVLLRALGYDEESHPGFIDRFVRHFKFPNGVVLLESQWEKERELVPTREEALVEIYKRARPGRAAQRRVGARLLRERLLQPEALRPHPGRPLQAEPQARPRARAARARPRDPHRAPGRRPGRAQPERDPGRHELPAAPGGGEPEYTIDAERKIVYRLDDQDHFANRRIRSVGELIQNQVRIGLSRMERVVRERMTTQDVEAITPQTLINIRPVVAAIKEFFGTSQLSPVHGPDQPAVGPHPQAPAVRARPGRAQP